jgi:CelD/BcsL family acetyltransferase involved in cellulose biosynthesis
VLALPRRRRFHRALCQKLLAQDRLRLFTLTCDGRAACVLLNYFCDGRYYFFIGGFDPAMMRWSVGTCLFAHVFQTAIEEGAHEFDFLKGAEAYKYRFGAVDRAYVNLSHFSPSLQGRYLQARSSLQERFMHFIHQRFGAGASG